MTTMSVTDVRKDLYKLIDLVNINHDTLLIKGKRKNAVLISEDDWLSLQETLYLVSQPGLRNSILEGMKEPVEECPREIDW
jgi:antitoxin YefM